MVAHTYYPDTQEAETGLLKVQCQLELHNENQASLGYTTMRDSCFCLSLSVTHTQRKRRWKRRREGKVYAWALIYAQTGTRGSGTPRKSLWKFFTTKKSQMFEDTNMVTLI